jgi:hypothetical protein
MTMQKDIVKAAIVASGGRFMTVTFRKMDGTIRKVNGKFNALSHTVSGERVDLKKAVDLTDPLIPFWTPKEGWKSFRVNSIVAIHTAHTKIVSSI